MPQEAQSLRDCFMRFLEKRRSPCANVARLNGVAATLMHGVVPSAEKLEGTIADLKTMSDAPQSLIDGLEKLLREDTSSVPRAAARTRPLERTAHALRAQRRTLDAKPMSPRRRLNHPRRVAGG